MSPLPPRSTRTATLFPYTTLFRSDDHIAADDAVIDQLGGSGVAHDEQRRHVGALHAFSKFDEDLPAIIEHTHRPPVGPIRSEERRAGKEGVSPCRSRLSQYH